MNRRQFHRMVVGGLGAALPLLNGPMFAVPASGGLRQGGGGDLNPGLHTDPGAARRFLDMRVGLSTHWGPSSQTGLEISWSRGKHGSNLGRFIPVEEYDQLYKTFNPVRFEAGEWTALMKRWGLRYLLPTGKHHDGFSLWFSKYSPYTMEKTPFRRDLMKELSEACREYGIVFGSYYSDLDWYHPDWTPYEPQPGPLFKRYADTPKLSRYLTYMQNQLLELIRDYDVQILQFDGEWPDTWTHEVGSKLYAVLRKAKPDIFLSNRIDKGREDAKGGKTKAWDPRIYAGDYEERERYVSGLATDEEAVSSWADHPSQEWVTIDRTQWSWNPNPDLRGSQDLFVDLIKTVGHNSNLLINVPPRPDGSFDSKQIAIMDQVGVWLHEYGESIYGTRGGPFYPADWGVSTRKDTRVFLHLLNSKFNKLELPPLSQKMNSASLFPERKPVVFVQTEKSIKLELPKGFWRPPSAVIMLEFDREPSMQTA